MSSSRYLSKVKMGARDGDDDGKYAEELLADADAAGGHGTDATGKRTP